MRKIFLFIAIWLCVSCDPAKYMDTHSTYWYLKNSTAETLIVAPTGYIEREILINPADSGCIYTFYPRQHHGKPSFELFYRIWERTPEEHLQHIDLLSTDKKLLKRWKFADRAAAGRELFKESCWRLYTKKTAGVSEQNFTWVFDIIPEDITDKNSGHLE